jgi:hypothetical protein
VPKWGVFWLPRLPAQHGVCDIRTCDPTAHPRRRHRRRLGKVAADHAAKAENHKWEPSCHSPRGDHIVALAILSGWSYRLILAVARSSANLKGSSGTRPPHGELLSCFGNWVPSSAYAVRMLAVSLLSSAPKPQSPAGPCIFKKCVGVISIGRSAANPPPPPTAFR